MLLNADVIDEVRETLGDATLRAFLSRMLAEAEDTSAQLLTLMAAADYATLAATSHRASGSAASVGAVALHAALKEIENTARGPAANTALPGLLDALPARISATRQALTSVVGPL